MGCFPALEAFFFCHLRACIKRTELKALMHGAPFLGVGFHDWNRMPEFSIDAPHSVLLFGTAWLFLVSL